MDEPYDDANEMVPEEVSSQSEEEYSSEWDRNIQKKKKMSIERKKYRKKNVFMNSIKLRLLKRLFKEHLEDVNSGRKKKSDVQKIASMLDVSVSTIRKKFSRFKLEAKNEGKEVMKKEIKFQDK